MTNTPFDPSTAETWEALARYVSGESSAQEAAALRAWLNADPQRQALLDTMRQTLAGMAAAPAANVDVERALQNVRARIDEQQVIPLPQRRPWLSPALRAAAVVALLATGLLVWRTLDKGDADAPQLAAQIHSTTMGQTDTVQLADGSIAVLGPSSELRIAQDYGTGARTVTLSGVAMFDVRHDDAQPFVVHAGDAIVRDLGTMFTVWHDAAGDVRVAVTEGAVMLHDGHADSVMLRAGDRGAVRAGATVAVRGAATEADNAWTRGELIFDGAALSDVAAELRRWYGIELQVSDATLRQRHVTATFRASDSAQDVLDVLAAVLGARVHLRGDTAVLSTGVR